MNRLFSVLMLAMLMIFGSTAYARGPGAAGPGAGPGQGGPFDPSILDVAVVAAEPADGPQHAGRVGYALIK